MIVNYNSMKYTPTPSFSANRTVLFVEDEMAILLGHKKTLPKKLLNLAPHDTFKVETASSVDEAKEKIIKLKPDILISDMQIDNPAAVPPDGVALGNFAKKNGVLAVGLQSVRDELLEDAAKNGFHTIKKDSLNILEHFNVFLGKLLKNLAV